MTTPDTHVEHQVVPGRRLGRRPHDPARPVVKLNRYLTGVVPEHPAAADHFSEISDWGLYENDRFGDCGPTSVANYVKLVTRYLTGVEQTVTQDDVFALYKLCNPDFDPATGAGDNGVNMQDMLNFLVTHGIGGKKALAWAALDVTDLDAVRAAIALFGGVLFGVDLQVAQQAQTDRRLWDYQPSAEWGGHAIVAGRYTSAKTGDDIAEVTWGEVVGSTDAFLTHQLQEAYVVLFEEHLGSTQFLQGVDVVALASDFHALTGHVFPVPIPQPQPTPQPVPSPVDAADLALAPLLRRFVSEHHVSHELRALAVVAKAWLIDKDLSG